MLSNIIAHKIFISLIFLVFISHFMSPHGADLGMAGLGILFLIVSANRIRTNLEVKYLQLFLVAFFIMIIIAVMHYKTAINDLEGFGITLFMVGVLALFAAILDITAFQMRFLKVNIIDLARLCSYAIIISVILKIIWVYFSKGPFFMEDVLFGHGRNAFLSGNLNPNKADDLFYFHITGLFFFNSILILKGKLDWKLSLASILISFYMLASFSVTGSKGAFGGVIAGFVFVIFLLTWKRNWYALGWYSGILFVVLVTIISFNSPRLQKFYSKIQVSSLVSTPAFVGPVERTSILIDDEKLTERNGKIVVAVKGEGQPEDKAFWNLNCTDRKKETERIMSNGFDRSSNIRIAMWQDGLRIWQQKPWLGLGEYDGAKFARIFDLKTPCLVASFSHLHNHYLEVMIRGGVLSLIVFISFYSLLIYALVSILLSNNSLSLAACPLLIHAIYLGVENFFDVTLIDNASQRSMLLSLAVMVGILFTITGYGEKQNKVVE